VSYQFRTTPTFRKALAGLSPSQKDSARRAFAIFKDNPFDARLRTHKIHALSARLRRTIYSARVEDDVRVVFYVDGELVVSLDIGSHDIYR
jgi:mRNA-degrading endonuclease YafQ of YafQ-DinJ toxin-antitoxin module